MARPIEHGLSYFPLDTDFDLDDKFQIITAKYGNDGLAIAIILFCKIFDNDGYFYKWTEKEAILISKRVNVNINTVLECVNDCINYEIFNKCKYNKYKILTSNGIQKRYLEAVKRRKEIHLIKEYLINVNINIPSSVVYVNINPQSKVKESKVNKKEIESKESDTFDFEKVWEMYPKKLGRKQSEKHFKATVKNETDFNNLIKAIENYKSEITKNKTEDKFIKHGSTFFNNWQDYVDLEVKPIRRNTIQEFKPVKNY